MNIKCDALYRDQYVLLFFRICVYLPSKLLNVIYNQF